MYNYESFEMVISKTKWLIVGKIKGVNVKRVIAECGESVEANEILDILNCANDNK